MKSSFYKIFNILVFITSVAIGGILFAVLALLSYYFNFEELTIPYLIISAVVSIFAGAFAYVIFSIPFDLAVKFDPIKNDIASGKLSDINEAQKVIGEFMVDFFNYAGADIVWAKVTFNGSDSPSVTGEDIDTGSINMSELKQKRKLRINSGHKAYYLPVIFEKEEIGHLLLVTRGFTFPLFNNILEYFEDFFLDDQVKCLTVKNG